MFKARHSKRYSFFKHYLILAVLACVSTMVSILIIIHWLFSHEDIYPLVFGIVLFILSFVQIIGIKKSAPKLWNTVFFKDEEIISKRVLSKDETHVMLNQPVYYVTLWVELAFENAKRIVLSNSPIDIDQLLDNPKQCDAPNQVSLLINSTETDFVCLEDWIDQGTVL